MDPKVNQEVLELYTQEISIKALKDAEQFLENSLPPGRGSEKERLLAKVLSEEQQIENNRKMIETLMNERDELNTDLAACDLKSLEEMRAERDELKKKRQEEKEQVVVGQRTINEILRMKRETGILLDAYMKQKIGNEEAKKN